MIRSFDISSDNTNNIEDIPIKVEKSNSNARPGSKKKLSWYAKNNDLTGRELILL